MSIECNLVGWTRENAASLVEVRLYESGRIN